MAQEPVAEAPPPGTAAHPVVDEAGPEAEVGSRRGSGSGPADSGATTGEEDGSHSAADQLQGGPAADVAATGTALHRGERTSDLDLDDAPAAAGPGAG